MVGDKKLLGLEEVSRSEVSVNVVHHTTTILLLPLAEFLYLRPDTWICLLRPLVHRFLLREQ